MKVRNSRLGGALALRDILYNDQTINNAHKYNNLNKLLVQVRKFSRGQGSKLAC